MKKNENLNQIKPLWEIQGTEEHAKQYHMDTTDITRMQETLHVTRFLKKKNLIGKKVREITLH